MAHRFCSLFLVTTMANAADFAHNWNGNTVTRSYNFYGPSDSCTNQGMVVALDPDGLGYCPDLTGLANSMCILVVCPTKASNRGAWLATGPNTDSEDVEFIAALIQMLQTTYSVPVGKIIITGFSYGATMAYRVWCEKSDVVTGIVAMAQAFFEPAVGQVGKDQEVQGQTATQTLLGMMSTARSNGNGCNPQPKRPHYAVVGTLDNYYGENGAGVYEGKTIWERMSTTVLGCTGALTVSIGASITVDYSNCYEYPYCQGLSASLNKYCSVPGRQHTTEGWQRTIRSAFSDFFSGTPSPTPSPSPSPTASSPTPSPTGSVTSPATANTANANRIPGKVLVAFVALVVAVR